MSNILDEKIIIREMRNELTRRLIESINEVEMFDKSGNLVIRKGLKVRHKDTQYEYTVDDVSKDPNSDDVLVHLKLPEEPRFEPTATTTDVITGSPSDKDILGEVDPPAVDDQQVEVPEETDGLEQVFVIDQSEFEDEYEVK